jgi:hypothetical protein
MKRIIVYLLFLHACIALAPSAWASWGRFVSTGTATGVGNPSCALVSTGHVACAVRNAQAAIMVNHFKGTAWGKWSSLVGTVSSDPSCTSDGAGKVLCAATATKGNLQVAIFNGTLFRAQLRRSHEGTSAMRRTKLHGRIGLVRLQRYFLEQVRQPRDFRRLRSGMCHRQRGRSDLCGVHDWRCHAGEPLRRRGLGLDSSSSVASLPARPIAHR